MNILLIASTKAEIAPFINLSANKSIKQINGIYETEGHNLSICITGVGGVATAYNLTKQLAGTKYDLVIQAGIAGSYTKAHLIGDIVCVNSEIFADLGANDNGTFLNLVELGLQKEDEFPFAKDKIYLPEHKYIPKNVPNIADDKKPVKLHQYQCIKYQTD
jgi:futalosine hydrolase